MARSLWKRVRRHERGQALVEVTVFVPILMVLLCGIIELGDAYNAYMGVVSSSRDGARLGARRGTDAQVVNLVIVDMGRLRDPTSAGDVTVSKPTVAGYPAYRVRVCHDHRLLIDYPLLPLPNPMRMCRETTMRLQGVAT